MLNNSLSCLDYNTDGNDNMNIIPVNKAPSPSYETRIQFICNTLRIDEKILISKLNKDIIGNLQVDNIEYFKETNEYYHSQNKKIFAKRKYKVNGCDISQVYFDKKADDYVVQFKYGTLLNNDASSFKSGGSNEYKGYNKNGSGNYKGIKCYRARKLNEQVLWNKRKAHFRNSSSSFLGNHINENNNNSNNGSGGNNKQRKLSGCFSCFLPRKTKITSKVVNIHSININNNKITTNSNYNNNNIHNINNNNNNTLTLSTELNKKNIQINTSNNNHNNVVSIHNNNNNNDLNQSLTFSDKHITKADNPFHISSPLTIILEHPNNAEIKSKSKFSTDLNPENNNQTTFISYNTNSFTKSFLFEQIQYPFHNISAIKHFTFFLTSDLPKVFLFLSKSSLSDYIFHYFTYILNKNAFFHDMFFYELFLRTNIVKHLKSKNIKYPIILNGNVFIPNLVFFRSEESLNFKLLSSPVATPTIVSQYFHFDFGENESLIERINYKIIEENFDITEYLNYDTVVVGINTITENKFLTSFMKMYISIIKKRKVKKLGFVINAGEEDLKGYLEKNGILDCIRKQNGKVRYLKI